MLETRADYLLRGYRMQILHLLSAVAHFVVYIEEFIVCAAVTFGFRSRRKHFDLAECVDKLFHGGVKSRRQFVDNRLRFGCGFGRQLSAAAEEFLQAMRSAPKLAQIPVGKAGVELSWTGHRF